jgi:hypothetical protein
MRKYWSAVAVRAGSETWEFVCGHTGETLVLYLLVVALSALLQYRWFGQGLTLDNLKTILSSVVAGALLFIPIYLYKLVRLPHVMAEEVETERDNALAKLEEKTGMPAYRPKIAIDSYKEVDGYGVTVGNDGYAAYEVEILKTQIGTTGQYLVFHGKAASMPHKAREFFEAKIEADSYYYGNKLLKAMLVAELVALNIEIIYTDLEYRGGELTWYKTTIALERKESEASGLRPRFISQELIPDPFKSGEELGSVD